MRTRTLVASTLAIAGSLASPAYADWVSAGKIVAMYADPSDVVVVLDHQEKCPNSESNSNFFHIRRTNTNFKEMTAIALTALAAGKRLGFFVETCVGDRSVVTAVRVDN